MGEGLTSGTGAEMKKGLFSPETQNWWRGMEGGAGTQQVRGKKASNRAGPDCKPPEGGATQKRERSTGKGGENRVFQVKKAEAYLETRKLGRYWGKKKKIFRIGRKNGVAGGSPPG